MNYDQNYDQIVGYYDSNLAILESYVIFLDDQVNSFQFNQFQEEFFLKKTILEVLRNIFEQNRKVFHDFLYSKTLTSKHESITLFLQKNQLENQLSREQLKSLCLQLEKIGKNLSYIRYFLEAIQDYLAQNNFKFGNITLQQAEAIVSYKFRLKENIENFEITPLFFQMHPKYGEEKISVLSLIQLLIDDIQYCIDLNRNVRELAVSQLIRS